MRIESSYPTPILGVSTLAPINRLRGHAEEQINFRSDPVQKLTRRPPCQWKRTLIPKYINKDQLDYHSYELDGRKISYIVDKSDSKIYCFIDGIRKSDLDLPAGFIQEPFSRDRLVLQTVDTDTYVLNTHKVVSLLPDTEENDIQKYSHINVLSALNYAESVTVNVILSPTSSVSVTYTVPDLGTTEPDYDTADKARATKQVATSLAGLIMAAHPDLTTSSLGSSVAVWNSTTNDWVSVEIETGQGDRSCVAINKEISTTNGLPLFAKVGTRITVRPDPTSDNGVYYLEAARIADEPSSFILEEVVWVESRSPLEPYKLDTSTMPLVITKNSVDQFNINEVSFRDRLKGDNTTVKVPDFVGSTIENIGYFQKRLVFLSDNNVIMSEADDTLNFWKQSAVQLLVSDPVSVSSSATGVDRLKYIVPHNRDLLIISSNSQFKISGAEGITPQSIAMSLTTRYECQTNTAPVTMGNSVFYPIDYGASTGIHEYSAEKNTTQDKAVPLTNHVIGYIKGKASLITANSNLEMIAMITDDPESINERTIYVYEQYTLSSGERKQSAWSKWIVSGDDEILAIEFKSDKLTLICGDPENNNIILKELDMYTRVATGNNDIYMDDLFRVTIGADNQATLPEGYNVSGMQVVLGESNQFPFDNVGYTVIGDTITIDVEENLQSTEVYIGKLYESSYTPTRPFKYDEDGTTITTDRIRVGRYIVELVETNILNMEIISDYYNMEDQVFNSRYVGALNNLVGKLSFHTGSVKMSFSQDASIAKARFYCDNHLGCNIINISWEGQYFQSKGRM